VNQFRRLFRGFIELEVSKKFEAWPLCFRRKPDTWRRHSDGLTLNDSRREDCSGKVFQIR
jgi:hypothetical protein